MYLRDHLASVSSLVIAAKYSEPSEVRGQRSSLRRKMLCKSHGTLTFHSTDPSAQALDRPTATVSPLRTQTSPSRLPSTSLRPRSVASPQHGQQSPAQMCPRPAIPFTSAASAITPPNVSAANLSGEVGGTPISGLPTPIPINSGYKPDDKKNEKVSGPSWTNPEPGAGRLLGPFQLSVVPRAGEVSVCSLFVLHPCSL